MNLYVLDVIGIQIAILCFLSLAAWAIVNELEIAPDSFALRVTLKFASMGFSLALIAVVGVTLLQG